MKKTTSKHPQHFTAMIVSVLLIAGCTTNQPAPNQPQTTTTTIKDPIADLMPKPGPNAKFSLEQLPRIDGSTVTIPISEAVSAKLLDLPLEDARMLIKHNKTHEAYVNLIDGKTDVIFVTYASDGELDYAKEKNVELEFIPIVKDAFVFFVNKENTVNGLRHEQIKDIYAGKITKWNQVGGANTKITAYQRPENSGSQSGMLELVMQGTPMMNAPTENRIAAMEGIIDAVAAYANSMEAIGYSYYYFVNSMYYQEMIKLLAVNDIAVLNETIENNTYPFITHYYAVLNKNNPNNQHAQAVIDYILSDEGQTLIEQIGYVKLGN